ncbi:MAG: SDR family oxidoreductase [bacterium]|nr:SDR family oxidoreductase [bacterium]
MAGSVLVTGGAKRIGKAICEALRARGWNVLVHSRDASNPLCADFDDPEAPARLFLKACELAPDLCAVVNNASAFSTAKDLSPDEAARLMRVNAEAPEKLAKFLGVRMMEHAPYSGSVVHLLDNRILSEPDTPTPYEASKIALRKTMTPMAARFGFCLRVNAVAPGPVLVPADAANSEKGGRVLLDHRPSPEDVAEAVAYLLEARSVTGQILAVDSGQSLRL